MELVGNHKGELLDHFHAARGDHVAIMAWDPRGVGQLTVRVLRSEHCFAGGAEDGAVPQTGQTLVYEGRATTISDGHVLNDVHYHYTVFAKGPDGFWHEQVRARVTPHEEYHWKRRPSLDADSSLAAFDRLRQLSVEMRNVP